jgi:hypothetical protein
MTSVLNQFALAVAVHQIFIDEQDNLCFMPRARITKFTPSRVEDYPINLDE